MPKRVATFTLAILAGTLVALLLHQLHHDPLADLVYRSLSDTLAVTAGVWLASRCAGKGIAAERITRDDPGPRTIAPEETA